MYSIVLYKIEWKDFWGFREIILGWILGGVLNLLENYFFVEVLFYYCFKV